MVEFLGANKTPDYKTLFNTKIFCVALPRKVIVSDALNNC